ncbi:MAG: hypothetical protein J6B74_04680 [Ruminococcus sp.]|nr:hypothetical protein [Ruminococcus sp.]
MNIHEILHRPVENMLMTGHTDTAENIFEFMPDYNSYFFKFTDNFLKIDFYEETAQLRLSICENLAFRELTDEPDFKTTWVSVIKMFLKDYVYSDFFIKKIILFNAVENGDSFMCDYAEVVFSDGLAVEKTLNFDPLNFWGISVDSKNEPPENAIITVIE